jgi:hypothetical protein
MKGWRVISAGVLCATLLGAHPSWAQDTEQPPAHSTARSAEAGIFLPLTLGSRVGDQSAYVTTLSGYDSARKSALMEGSTEISLVGPLGLRAGAVYTDAGSTLKPTFGLHVQALRQDKHGVDGSVGVFYKPEGLTEGEGEVEAVFTIGRREGRWGMFANVVYGQDPEAAERDGEVRLAALYSLSERVQAGLDTRLRFDLGSDQTKRRAKLEADFDLMAGPTASWVLGPIALIGQTGMSAVRITDLRLGMVALGGIGAAF